MGGFGGKYFLPVRAAGALALHLYARSMNKWGLLGKIKR